MQSSILAWIFSLLEKVSVWFDASLFGKAFNKVSSFCARVFSGSMFGKFFSKKSVSYLEHSLLGKLLLLPVTLCQKFAQKTHTFWGTVKNSSTLYWLLSNWNSISIRSYGFSLLAFTLSYGVLHLVFSSPSVPFLILVAGFLCISLCMILINRSIKSLFKGSRLLTALGSIFAKIQKDVDSKLFFSEPEFIVSKSVFFVLFGIVLGILAHLLPTQIFVLLFCGVFYVLISLRYTVFCVYTVIALSPILPTMVLMACCLLATFSFALQLLTNKNLKLRPVPLAGCIVFFVIAMGLGTINSFTFTKSLQILLIYISFILFYFVSYQTLNTKKKWQGAVIVFSIMALFVALYGIYQNFSGALSSTSWVDEDMFEKIKTRVYSTFDNPNVLGEYLVMSIPILVALTFKGKTHGQKTLYAGIFLCLCLCIIFTWSRGAWLGVLLASLLFLLVMDKRFALLCIVGVLCMPFVFGADSAIVDRIVSIGNTKDSSTAYRVSIWQASINMIRDFWLSGIGLGSDAFAMIYPKYALAGANYALHSHNLFLQIVVESGICGIVSFISLLLVFFKQCFSLQNYHKRKTHSGLICLAIAAGVLGFLFQGLTDNVWYNYKMVLIFWIMLSLASSKAAADFNGGDEN